jgi:hypothetical protein
MGPPKQAEKPMMGAYDATVKLATKSASELPIANTVRPIMASESPNMSPKVYVDMSEHCKSVWAEEGTHIEDLDNLISNSHDPHHGSSEARQTQG